MARGSKISDEVKERAFALLAANDNVQSVADELGLPRTTVNTWKKKWEQEEKDAPSEDDGVCRQLPRAGRQFRCIAEAIEREHEKLASSV